MDLQFSPLEKTNHLTTVLGTAWLYFAACRPQMAIYPRLVICAIGQRYLSQFIIIGQEYYLNLNHYRTKIFISLITI